MNHDSHVQLAELFAGCVVSEDGCWVWQGAREVNGYAAVSRHGRKLRGHRLTWEIVNGKNLGPLLACHHCDNPPCINPAHIFPGTQKDNMQDASRKGRIATGDKHGTRRRPECIARGDRHGTHTHPECYRGDRNSVRQHPGQTRGERNANAILTEAKVIEIRAMYAAGMKQRDIAERFGVTRQTIQSATSGHRWGHVAFEVSRG